MKAKCPILTPCAAVVPALECEWPMPGAVKLDVNIAAEQAQGPLDDGDKGEEDSVHGANPSGFVSESRL